MGLAQQVEQKRHIKVCTTVTDALLTDGLDGTLLIVQLYPTDENSRLNILNLSAYHRACCLPENRLCDFSNPSIISKWVKQKSLMKFKLFLFYQIY